MIGGGALSGSEGQMERGTTLACVECATPFAPKNKNGVPARFCSRRCLDRNRNTRRLKAAANVAAKSTRKQGPSAHAQKVSRFVFLNMVPVEQRADLLREAAQNLGITDEGELLKVLRRNGCTLEQAIRHQPSAISSGGSLHA